MSEIALETERIDSIYKVKEYYNEGKITQVKELEGYVVAVQDPVPTYKDSIYLYRVLLQDQTDEIVVTLWYKSTFYPFELVGMFKASNNKNEERSYVKIKNALITTYNDQVELEIQEFEDIELLKI